MPTKGEKVNKARYTSFATVIGVICNICVCRAKTYCGSGDKRLLIPHYMSGQRFKTKLFCKISWSNDLLQCTIWKWDFPIGHPTPCFKATYKSSALVYQIKRLVFFCPNNVNHCAISCVFANVKDLKPRWPGLWPVTLGHVWLNTKLMNSSQPVLHCSTSLDLQNHFAN